jgi:hypothetical protein
MLYIKLNTCTINSLSLDFHKNVFNTTTKKCIQNYSKCLLTKIEKFFFYSNKHSMNRT